MWRNMNNKYLFGSKMLKLNNPRDEDWLEFVDVPRGTKIDNREHNRHRLGFEQRRIKSFIEDRNMPDDSFKSLIFYQLSNGFHEEDDYPFKDFNILNYKDIWIKQLKNYINQDSTEKFALAYNVLHKKFYHLLYQYYMIIEDTHFISDAAKEKVQEIHDLETNPNYFYELKHLINTL